MCTLFQTMMLENDGTEDNGASVVGLPTRGELFTMFLPTDEAFDTISPGDILATRLMSVDTVLFHLVKGTVLRAADLPCETGNNLLQMANGKNTRTLCVSDGNDAVLVPLYQKGGGNNVDTNNLPTLLDTDIKACDGIVHIIDHVLLPSLPEAGVSSSSSSSASSSATTTTTTTTTDSTTGAAGLPEEVCTPAGIAVDCLHESCTEYVPGSCYEITELYQTMVPDMRACYADRYDRLYDAGLLWNQRPERGIPAIAAASVDTDDIVAKHMQIDIALGFDHWDIIDRNVNEILEEDPEDPHALFVQAVYGSEGVLPSVDPSEFPALLEYMYQTVPATAQRADQFYADHKMLWYYEFLHPFTTGTEYVDVCGQGMDGEVTGPLFPNFECVLIPDTFDPKSLVILVYGAAEGYPLEARIETTRQLGTLYPDAPIIATGAAVSTDKSEGDLIYEAIPEFQDRIIVDRSARDTIGNSIFVADWLAENEIENLFLISSTYHLARATIALRGVLQTKDLHPHIYLVGAGNNVQTPYMEWSTENQAWLETDYSGNGRFIDIEIPVSYREYSRGAGMFTLCDFMALEGLEMPK
eukprot:CAMPEP_0170999576 /NCGR_PEP_ID=MMETSP0736-20130129/14202_1 /TAXON_ID=186038 /ORGANISM="Fragilariopsis kerguelensis, Strain L26-C5" /LENGTH=583 /DNA_ID=CAMNT_0011426813 /DNA_START=175 /DNA_END=1926 /DNA_ORIENTATION=-